AGDARQHRFAPSAETGKIVESDDAGQQQPVSLDGPAVYADIDSVGGPADGHQARRIVAVVVSYPDAAAQSAENFFMFVVGLGAMNPERDQDFHIPVGYTLAVESFHQQGEVDLARGIAGDVGGDDDDLLARLEGGNGRLAAIKRRGIP